MIHAISRAHVTLQIRKFNGSALLLLSEACLHFCDLVNRSCPRFLYKRLIFGEQSMLLFYFIEILCIKLLLVNAALKCVWESKCLTLNYDETWTKYVKTVSILLAYKCVIQVLHSTGYNL